jgi:phosphoglycerate dehydrogenase-like enzyme
MAEKKGEPLTIVVALSHDADPYSALQDALAATDIPADSYRLVRSLGKKDLEDNIGEADVAIVWHFAPELLRRAKRLQWVHFAMAGVDDALHPALVESPVQVTASVGVHAVPVAEHAFAMILAFARGLVPAFANQFQRRWGRRSVVYSIQELQGLTLGVVGLGHIGRAVAALGRAFGMHVVGVNRHGGAVEGVEEVFTPDGLAKVLSRADYVVLCVPLTAETRGMFGVDEFRLMKDTAYLVNVGRGPLVREDTLLEALRRRWIAGAGLDVFETEPLPPDHPLYNLDNVIISPHVAGVTPYYWERMAKLFVENLKRFLAGEELEKKVDKARGY